MHVPETALIIAIKFSFFILYFSGVVSNFVARVGQAWSHGFLCWDRLVMENTKYEGKIAFIYLLARLSEIVGAGEMPHRTVAGARLATRRKVSYNSECVFGEPRSDPAAVVASST